MDLKSENLMNYLRESLSQEDVSGFELLEILDIRSQLASREPLLDDIAKAHLEHLDRQLTNISNSLAGSIADVADLPEMRKRAHVLPSHWWWYLDEMGSAMRGGAAVG